MATMNNFRAEDMPGAAKKDAKPAVAVEEVKKEAEQKKAPAKKTAPKKEEPKVEVAETEAPAQTDTETHGVGPSTVEGGDKAAEDAAEEESK